MWEMLTTIGAVVIGILGAIAKGVSGCFAILKVRGRWKGKKESRRNKKLGLVPEEIASVTIGEDSHFVRPKNGNIIYRLKFKAAPNMPSEEYEANILIFEKFENGKFKTINFSNPMMLHSWASSKNNLIGGESNYFGLIVKEPRSSWKISTNTNLSTPMDLQDGETYRIEGSVKSQKYIAAKFCYVITPEGDEVDIKSARVL